MRNKRGFRLFSMCMALMLCMTAFSVTAFASGGDHYASDENGNATPPPYIEDITVSTENVTVPEQKEDQPALTPDGNMTLIDDILQNDNFASVEEGETVGNKQFITVQSKNGNYFYLVIDRSGDTENVYFLNLVDEADLLALMESGETETTPVVCSCTDKCAAGAVNTACEICKVNMSECVGKEAVTEPEPTTPTEPEEPKDEGGNNTLLLLLVLLILSGGGALAYFKLIKPKQGVKVSADPDDYEFEDEEYMADDTPDETEDME